MALERNDTICAIATPPGIGGVGVIRVSGPDVPQIAKHLIKRELKPRLATHTLLLSEIGQTIDDGIVIYFPNPKSFTGEDVLEIQGHGSPVVMDMLIDRLNDLGARLARPGEFSERAFLNGKIDLTQAEAIADLIESSTQQSARAALRSLSGEFSQQVHDLVDQLIYIRTYIESAIDFPEEEIDFLAESDMAQRLEKLKKDLLLLLNRAKQGRLLRDGMNIVLAGSPNVGKSSLLNKLAGYDAAIVTDIAGTTRDTLKEHISIDGMPVHIIDTAGIRETDDVVEKEGMKRTWSAIEKADRILLIIDSDQNLHQAVEDIHKKLPQNLPVTIVRNKIDQDGKHPKIITTEDATEVFLSAMTGAGIELLCEHLKQTMGFHETEDGDFIARRRHLNSLNNALLSIEQAQQQFEIDMAGELAAEDLRIAQQHLNQITGEFTSDDLLGEIFSSFCIGK
ncbi:MAG: tRNA uridine-5-carboxymethylaminomethyl(34) synthesis GTPase MnmE [Gammaproteobacteria bacterium]|nr:MAG: tRNA uridine-5-carboxymethylaminomethyl(34) synthesis GTPase MnmE [Gammaproteobacteria bacterium]